MDDSSAFLLLLVLFGGGAALMAREGDKGDGQKPLPSKPQHRLVKVGGSGDDTIYRVETLVLLENGLTEYRDEPPMYVIGTADKSSFVSANAGTISLELGSQGAERVDALIFNTLADAEAYLTPPADDPSGPQKQPEPEEEPELPPSPVLPQPGLPSFGGESSYGF